MKEFDADRRARLSRDLRARSLRRALRCHARDQVDYVGVEQKVSAWQTLAYVPMETNYEYVS